MVSRTMIEENGITRKEIRSPEQEIHQEKFEPTVVVGNENESQKLKLTVKKALEQFRSKLQDAILGNYLLGPPNKAGNHCLVNLKAKENLKEISLWGIPLLPSKGHEGTDVILLKFLQARDYKVIEAFEMLQKTLKWRKEFKTEGILEENFESELENVAFMDSTDEEGHPLCYVIYGAFRDKNLYRKIFGSEKKSDFLRWRIQLMEKGMRKLNLKAGGVDSMVQITDLKNSPGPGTKELRTASKKVVLLIQDYYPEFILRNIIINVPFWYYAYHTLFCRILSQRAKNKFILVRSSRVAKTLLKFIAVENLLVQYGGLKRENDEEFSPENRVSQLIVKGGAMESIQIPVPEPGVTVVWDFTVVGWDVNYKEEFVPDDECSYRILIQKEKKMVASVRSSFYINEPGKILLTINNGSFYKKKVLYRHKLKPTFPMYIYLKK